MSFANSIVRPAPAPVSQQALPAPVSQQGNSDTLGIGGIFSQMNQSFQNQMGMMRSQPLNVYRNYLQETYVAPEAQQVDEFVGLVDQAERAHFDAEESFGFGGGPMAQNYMQKMPEPYQQQQGKSDTLGIGSSAMGFENGGNPVLEMTQKELLDSGTLPPHTIIRNFAVDPDRYYDDARTEWDRGDYVNAAGSYLVGLSGELPWSSSMAGVLADFLESREQTPEPAVKNYEQGGVAGLFQTYAEGGAVSSIPDEALSAMREKVLNDYGFDPVNVATEEGVDPELFLRVMWTENKGRQGPVSEAGAIGLMQLMPDTAEELGVNPNDPLQNARGGARYLRQQLRTFRSVPLALAAYNAGPGNVQKYNGVPPFEETRNYIAQIQGVDTGEILPEMDQFYTFADKKPPAMMPQPRPEGLGTPEYVPPAPVQSEYLTTGVRSLFAPSFSPPPQRAPRSRQPAIPDIMGKPSQMPDEDDTAMGIEYYRQFSALPNRNLG